MHAPQGERKITLLQVFSSPLALCSRERIYSTIAVGLHGYSIKARFHLLDFSVYEVDDGDFVTQLI